MPFVGLNSVQLHAGKFHDLLRQLDNTFAWWKSAAAHPDIDFNKQVNCGTRRDRSTTDGFNLIKMINGHGHACPFGQFRKATNLHGTDNLVRNQQICDAMICENLGLPKFRAGDTDGIAGCQLTLRQGHTLVILEVWPQLRLSIRKELRHLRQIAITGGSIQQKRWRIKIFDRLSDSSILRNSSR
jgi:hypothetical protein